MFCGRCGTKLAAPGAAGNAPVTDTPAPSAPASNAPAGHAPALMPSAPMPSAPAPSAPMPSAPAGHAPAPKAPAAGPTRTATQGTPDPFVAPAPTDADEAPAPRATDANPRTRKTRTRKARKPAKKRSKVPIVVAALVLVLAAVGAFAFLDPLHVMPWTNTSASDASSEAQSAQSDDERISISVDDGSGEGEESSEDDGSNASSTQSSSNSGADGTGLSLTEEDPDRISPKDSIEVSNLEIKEDAVKRYVVTGTITNKNKEAYDVKAYLSFTNNYFDSKYHEPKTESTNADLQTADAFTRATGNSVTFYDLEPGSRTFTLYPNWSSAEATLTDPQIKIDSVSLPDARERWRYDHKGDINIGETKLEADGTLTIDFTNETGLYLNTATITVVAYNDQNMPAVYNNSGARPYGIKVFELSASALKPGDKGTFKKDVGEGYSKVKIVDVRIEPDPDKNSFN